MNFNMDFYEMSEAYAKYRVYHNDTDTYDTLVFANTGPDCGFFPQSDVIAVFDDKTGAMLAFIERVHKPGLSLKYRLKLLFHAHRAQSYVPYGYECFVQKRSDFYEFQYYKRWWFDLSVQLGGIDISKCAKRDSVGGQNESSPGDI